MLQQTMHTLDGGGFISANIVGAGTKQLPSNSAAPATPQPAAAAPPAPAPAFAPAPTPASAGGGGYGVSKKKGAAKPGSDTHIVQAATVPQQLAPGCLWRAIVSFETLNPLCLRRAHVGGQQSGAAAD